MDEEDLVAQEPFDWAVFEKQGSDLTKDDIRRNETIIQDEFREFCDKFERASHFQSMVTFESMTY
jgi:hypothetical protein